MAGAIVGAIGLRHAIGIRVAGLGIDACSVASTDASVAVGILLAGLLGHADPARASIPRQTIRDLEARLGVGATGAIAHAERTVSRLTTALPARGEQERDDEREQPTPYDSWLHHAREYVLMPASSHCSSEYRAIVDSMK